jgi:hypothetical protein
VVSEPHDTERPHDIQKLTMYPLIKLAVVA